MIDPMVLRDRLLTGAGLLGEPVQGSEQTRGQVAWGRAYAWTKPVLPSKGERGGGVADGATDERIEDRMADARAARYWAELEALTKRLTADLTRLETIVAACTPPPSKQLHNRDLLTAQIAAEGWCVSCYRDDQHLEPVAEARYRDRCRPCGDWRGEHGEDPPKAILVLRHSGRRITTAAVAQAMK